MTFTETYWRTADETRHFIIPDAEPRRPGELALRSLVGDEIAADPAWAARFEVTKDEARAWAQEEFGFMLGQLKQRIDAKLAEARASLDDARHAPIAPESELTADAIPAVVELMRKLPRAILDALSGDAAQTAEAKDELAAVERRLGAAGVDVAPKLGEFPARLAALREAQRKPEDG